VSLSNSKQLSNEEDTWLTNLIPNHQQKTPANHNTKNRWEIRLDKAEFDIWRKALNRKCLFFDGASKGNRGKAGSGGVILCENGSIISSFHWGLGTSTNNIAESSGLLQGLRIALTLGITKLTVFGDSKLLIQSIHSKTPPANLNLTRPFLKIQALCKKFEAITFYHILRELNHLADGEANKGTTLDRGILNLNGTISRYDLP
jgi:ribonuclease HI